MAYKKSKKKVSKVNIIREDKLIYHSGKSNKLYKLTMLRFPDDTFSVYGLFGKRWSYNLRRSDKCNRVSLYDARNIYDKVLNEKFRKGYQEV